MKNSFVLALRCLAPVVAAIAVIAAGPALAQKKPNILVIWGDDIGYWNVSAYNQGMMGYKTPNIDRIAKEGMLFTGEGLQPEDPTIAELLKSHGHMTGQFGKNHLGDRDEHLPTNHGFDEFFGNLYHLNAEEEPENEDYPKDPAFREKYGPRGVIKSSSDGSIEDTGTLNRKRMETVDEETLASAALDFMDRAVEQDKPFFVWWNATRMHVWTHLKDESKGVTGLGTYPDGMTAMSASSSTSSTRSASPTTPSSCTRPTTVPRPSPGPMAAPRRSGVRRTRTGKAATACRWR